MIQMINGGLELSRDWISDDDRKKVVLTAKLLWIEIHTFLVDKLSNKTIRFVKDEELILSVSIRG